MNKKEFINKLKEKTNYTEEKCIEINNILENNFIIANKNKTKIINELIEKLNVEENEADKIYNTSMEIIAGEVKNKIKHPFGN